MALQKHKIPLPIDVGLDTKTDEFLAIGMSKVENAIYTETGAIKKRAGSVNYVTDQVNLSSNLITIDTPISIHGYKDEILLNTKKQLLAYSTAYGKWISKNFFNFTGASLGYPAKNTGILPVTTENKTVFGNIAQAVFPGRDVYVDSNYKAYLASVSDNSGGESILIRVDDFNTNTVVLELNLSELTLNASLITIQGNYLYFNTTGKIGKLNLTSPNTAPTYVSLGAAISFPPIYINGFIYASTTGPAIVKYNISNDTFTSTSVADVGQLYDSTTSGTFYLRMISEGASSYVTRIFDSTLTVTSTHTISLAGKTRLGFSCNHGPISYITYNYLTTADSKNNQTDLILLDKDNTNVDGTTYTINYGLNANTSPVNVIDSNFLYYVSQTRGNNTFLWAHNISTGSSKNHLSTPAAISGDSNSAGVSSKIVLLNNKIYYSLSEYADGSVFGGFQFDVEFYEHNLNSKLVSKHINDSIYFSGSIPKRYDGKQLVEGGYLQYPQISSVTETAGAGPLTAGTYGIAVVYEWIDNTGKIERSAPGFFTKVLGATATRFSIVSFNNQNTYKENVKIIYYMTEVNGSIYYRLTNETTSQVDVTNNRINTLTNDLTQEFLTSGANTSSEILYTVSGELENDFASSSKYIEEFKNRLFMLGDKELSYSKPITVGESLGFSLLQKIQLESKGGKPIGLAAMDNVLLLFKKEAIFILSGEGPNALGQNNDYGNPQLITSDVGCVDPMSIIATPEGIMFKSEKGIYLLNRGLYVSYIGAAVEDYNNEEILSAQLINDTNEVRFLTENRTLVYDYLHKKWTTFTSDYIYTTIHDNTYHMLLDTGVVRQEGTFKDNGVFYPMKINTNWVTVGSININGSSQSSPQGFQRLYNINILGKFKSAHNLTVGIAYDYNDTIVDTATIVPTGTGVYQFEVKPSIQKCEAFKLYIQDVETSGSGESMSISSFMLEIGIKGSAQKVVADGNRFPAT